MSSLFVAVTLTPLNEVVVAVTVRGPDALASPDGIVPLPTRLCDLPLSALTPVRSIGV
jgi:hypothetical protein